MALMEVPAHVSQRIAEEVGRGWPAYEVSSSQVEEIITLALEGLGTAAICIRLDRGVGMMVVEAVIAEANTYGFEVG